MSSTIGNWQTDAAGLPCFFSDKITGEAKLRAVFEINPWSGKLKLRQLMPLE